MTKREFKSLVNYRNKITTSIDGNGYVYITLRNKYPNLYVYSLDRPLFFMFENIKIIGDFILFYPRKCSNEKLLIGLEKNMIW